MNLDVIDEVILTQLYAGPQSTLELGKTLTYSVRLIQERIDQLVAAGLVAPDSSESWLDRFKVVPVSKNGAAELAKTSIAGPAYHPAPRPLVGYDEQLRRFRDNCMATRTR